MARPEEYKEEYIGKVSEYLKQCIDFEREIDKLKVKLPTIEGFARFLDVSKKTLYNWGDKYPEFLHALGKILTEQQERLINSGLSGEYNSTIAKLILSSNHGMSEKTKVESEINLTENIYANLSDEEVIAELEGAIATIKEKGGGSKPDLPNGKNPALPEDGKGAPASGEGIGQDSGGQKEGDNTPAEKPPENNGDNHKLDNPPVDPQPQS